MSGTTSCVWCCTQAPGGTEGGHRQVGEQELWGGDQGSCSAHFSPGRSPNLPQGYALGNGAPLLSQGCPPCCPPAGGLWDPAVGWCTELSLPPDTHLCSWKILLQRILKLSLPIQFRDSLTSVSIRPHNNNQMFQLGPDQGAPGEQPGCSHSPRSDASSE